MIYTVTLNPSLDYIVGLEDLELGKVNRAGETYKFPGGKGINVSRVLKRLGHSSCALGFIGGFTGDFIQSAIEMEEIETDFVVVDGDSRINVKVRADLETEINGPSPGIDPQHLDLLKKKFSSIRENDVVILAGSLPENLEPSYYRELIELVPEGARVIVDTKGVPLNQAILARPFLIKPNHHELGDLFNVEIITSDEAEKYARKLVDKGAEHVIVSMAGNGALLVTSEGSYTCNVPKGKVVNSVGAGDSVVAGFVSSYLNHGNILEAFQYGVAAGSASAFSLEFCTKKEVEELFQTIQVREFEKGGE
ncbi:1-phosphofructokinase [Pseudalkalibacillus salsuginis]|uniref:1-phosphofructokinase n=1 Tax=Pseudalkalibacillus salsuginis TaxID=2910972 RepID=UPI001F388408|nr:1-phosphofructokinase [Pseudalkalibacillus salsuginis]MCF6409335.1 1-phosphofructokinase [Pseudalkalibacillus salsuginis]